MELRLHDEHGRRPDEPAHTTIVFGYGNPGRQDDGLGPAAAEAIADLEWPGVTAQSNYQLNIEDADEASTYQWAVFVDATISGPEPFTVRRATPASEVMFSSHVMSPETLLAICRDYYGRAPHAVVVAIRGYEFEFGEALSPRARDNLAHALHWITQYITARRDSAGSNGWDQELSLERNEMALRYDVR